MVMVLIYGLYGLVLLVVLWPTPQTGRRLLKKWHVHEPTDEQIAEAVRYLKRRRLLYPWLYLGVGLLSDDRLKGGYDILVTVLAGTLLAELIALRPPRQRQREATLLPRRLFQIASPVLVGFYLFGVAVCAGFTGYWHDWRLVFALLASVLVVGVIMWSAVVRPASGDPQVDSALRTRSIHVSAGLGIALAGALAGWWFALGGILMWVSMANTPPRERVDA